MQRQFSSSQFNYLLCSWGLIALMFASTPLFAENDELKQAREAINAMEYSVAVSKLKTYLKTHPDDIRRLHLLAKTYAWDNQYEEASKVYDQLLAVDPSQVEYLYGKAEALLWSEQIGEAISLLEKAWSLQPENAEILRSLLLSLNQSSTPEHKQRAKELGKIALEKFPNMHWDLIID